ncbi:DNA starvation/stationary phase protection protein [Anaerococcus sp. AGMB00486]|uniref:DNA starvation/stationary phase protection protein n=2 Tax=Anaerococcus TaxID=165779 RepID=A0ABX2N8G1_9FIRM|nr:MULTISPECIES: DNA starvation/stationary phase protection protein [Anaerococcus]MDY3006667.1 DNA starvation/stationary phase protection protein [Anaerococcus porci]MSS77264.1 DNA starvation/stationary phase protection protein [Anaerococcus porci]NVF10933.1 DNA starvation/stationary phase protection protein [Anaerococcus faecalis]
MNKKLDIYLANIMVENIKLHHLHWNIVGKSFVRVHEYFESQYNAFFERYDEIAEIQKMQGYYPNADLKSYLNLTTIDEISKSEDIEIRKALEIYLEDLNKFKELALEIRKEADKNDDFQITNTMEEHIEAYNKEIWFIKASLK